MEPAQDEYAESSDFGTMRDAKPRVNERSHLSVSRNQKPSSRLGENDDILKNDSQLRLNVETSLSTSPLILPGNLSDESLGVNTVIPAISSASYRTWYIVLSYGSVSIAVEQYYFLFS